MPATHSIQTPINSVGAVSILTITASDMEHVFQALSIKPLDPGSIRLAKIFDLDDALLARFDECSLSIMPHGGVAITRAVSRALSSSKIPLEISSDPQTLYPEAEDIYEARMLAALSIAPSPLAVDLLLDQPRRWRSVDGEHSPGPDECAKAASLNRLIVPPVVVAIGRANIGKSSLVNALAGDPVAIVSNQAGTTRDHLGVLLNLAGVVVRWIDTPGIDQSVELGDELDLMSPMIQSADLIVHAVDASADPEPLDPRLSGLISASTPVLQIAVRSDLAPESPSSVLRCSSKTGQGIEGVTGAIADQLVPESDRTDPRPWRFWDS